MQAVFEAINGVFGFIGPLSDLLWDFPTNFEWYRNIPILGNISLAIIVLLGSGIFFTIKLGFIQVTHFKKGIRLLTEKRSVQTGITPLAAFLLSAAMRVGPGNIIGVTGAIAVGGPGALFWMWISALLGMVTKYSEVTLAVHYRQKNKHGDWVGGPMYYIQNGLGKKWKWLGVLFAIFGVFAVFGTGNATQVNTIVASIDTALISFGVMEAGSTSTLNLILGIVITILVGLILLGGIKRIGHVAERLVPIMALLYVVLGLGVIIVHIGNLPAAFSSIIKGAFNPTAVTGGVVGAMFTAVQKGVARGIFSNEAGLGTASIAHAGAEVNDPVQQGLFGVFEVFVDTIIICTFTALVILCSGVPITFGAAAGAELTISGFTSTYGNWITIFTAVAMCCFAFTTILGWGLYGARCSEYLFGEKVIKPFMVIYSLVAIIGATVKLDLLWSIAETFNGMMAIPNLIAVALLSPVVLKLTKEYFTRPKESPLCK